MRVSIGEVATKAGVSRATVSKVLSGGRDTISFATQERVRTAANELGYHPNAIARSLRRRRTDIIGFYSGYPTAFWQIDNIQRGCETYKQDLLIHGTFRHSSPEAIIAELEGGKIDGLIIVAPTNDELAHRLIQSSLPVVAFADAVPGLPSVVVDDKRGGEMMAEHLFAKGHRRVLFRGVREKRESANRRAGAFMARASELGMTALFPTATDFPGQLTDEEIGLLTAPPDERFTGVACWNDAFLFPVLHASDRLNLRVPEDLSLISFGDQLFDPVTLRRVTNVIAPWASAAQTAVSVLMERIAGQEMPIETVLPVELYNGDTA